MRTSLNWKLQQIFTAITTGTMADSTVGSGWAGHPGSMGQIRHPLSVKTLKLYSLATFQPTYS
jgi:hypothetical protein